MNPVAYEPIAKYKFTEEFAGTIKSTEFTTNDLNELFSRTMEFLLFCGITESGLYEMFDNYKEEFI